MNPLIRDWQLRWGINDAAVHDLARLTHAHVRIGTGQNSSDIQNLICIEASKYGLGMWRNNSGVSERPDGTPVRFGLGNISSKLNKKWKSPDLIGVGYYGISVWCEVKHPGWTKPESDRDRAQMTALTQVCAMGGIGFFATSVECYRLRVLGIR